MGHGRFGFKKHGPGFFSDFAISTTTKNFRRKHLKTFCMLGIFGSSGIDFKAGIKESKTSLEFFTSKHTDAGRRRQDFQLPHFFFADYCVLPLKRYHFFPG